MKSKKQLDSFIKHCEKNPSERFWQALRNWSEYDYIYGNNTEQYHKLGKVLSDAKESKIIEDTFYKE